MPTNDYMPHTDEGFETWGTVFATNIASSPGTYLLTAAQAASISAVITDYSAKLAIAENPMTRNVGTVADKEDAKAIAMSLCRGYAMLIKEASGISDADKLFIGVRPENNSREKIDCPQTSPLLNILGATPGTQTIVYADSTTPDKKARPFGASELQLFMGLTEDGEATLAQAQFVGKFTRNPITVDFTEAQDGLVATFYARWASVRGETGPWSLPISMRVAA